MVKNIIKNLLLIGLVLSISNISFADDYKKSEFDIDNDLSDESGKVRDL